MPGVGWTSLPGNCIRTTHAEPVLQGLVQHGRLVVQLAAPSADFTIVSVRPRPADAGRADHRAGVLLDLRTQLWVEYPDPQAVDACK